MRLLIPNAQPMERSTVQSMILWIVLCASVTGQVSREERASVTQLTSQAQEASRLLTDDKLDEAADLVAIIQSQLVKLLDNRENTGLQRLARPVYERLVETHNQLELEAIELEPLPTWEELTNPKTPPSTGVSFRESIAPWLVQRCGRCHIDRQQGNFSLASFTELRRGTPAGVVIFPGDARNSRLVEVLETGDMPRGGGQISTQQIEQLKQWINSGAAPDQGLAPTQPLRELVVSSGGADSLNVSRATGDEQVSFVGDVAPILLDNCSGCHIGGQRPSGNLRMDTLADLLRGGDSGQIIEPGNSSESLLIKKVRGESGTRMPAGGRPTLSPEQIETLSLWIKEGARFDGSNASATLEADAQLAWASKATHQELFAKRQEKALANWKKVSPNKAATIAKNASVFVLGDLRQDELDRARDAFEKATLNAKSILRLPKETSWLPGGLVVYALNSRYQYSEFGQMLERRELPQSWQAHWNRDGIVVYAAALLDEAWTEESADQLALLTVVGSYLGSFNEVPYWFAEGIARNAVVAQYRRGEPLISEWQQAAPRAYAALQDSTKLASGELNEETSALIGMGLTRVMLSRANRQRFDTLLEKLRQGSSFDAAMRASFGPPDAFIKTTIGR